MFFQGVVIIVFHIFPHTHTRTQCLLSTKALTRWYSSHFSSNCSALGCTCSIILSPFFLPGGRWVTRFGQRRVALIRINLWSISGEGERKNERERERELPCASSTPPPPPTPPFQLQQLSRNRSHPINPTLPKGLSNQPKSWHRN